MLHTAFVKHLFMAVLKAQVAPAAVQSAEVEFAKSSQDLTEQSDAPPTNPQ